MKGCIFPTPPLLLSKWFESAVQEGRNSLRNRRCDHGQGEWGERLTHCDKQNSTRLKAADKVSILPPAASIISCLDSQQIQIFSINLRHSSDTRCLQSQQVRLFCKTKKRPSNLKIKKNFLQSIPFPRRGRREGRTRPRDPRVRHFLQSIRLFEFFHKSHKLEH